MRILYVANLTPHARSEQRLRVLRALGHDVVAVPSMEVLAGPHEPRRLPFVPRVLNRVGLPLDLEGTNRAVLEIAVRREFELLWVEKATTLRAQTLDGFRRLQPAASLAFFSEDDMVLRHNGSFWFRGALPLYDVVVTTKLRNVRDGELAALGARRVVYEPKTFDPDFHRPLEVSSADRERLGADVLFVGTYERRRAESCLALARAGLPVRVFGHGWERARATHPGLRVEQRGVGGTDYVRALCASRIALGFLREASRDEHTDRSVEIPACGAFLLAQRSDEHLALFREHREAAYFGDDDELVAQARRYLADETARAEVAAAGRRRCLDAGFDHAAACRRILAAATGAPHRSEVEDPNTCCTATERSAA